MASSSDVEVDDLSENMETFLEAMDTFNMEIIDSLILMKHKDPRFPLDTNNCAIMASKRGNLAVLAKILVLDHQMSYSDVYGRRAIHYAAKNGHLECVKLLLKAGSISNCSDILGKTPLHLACSKGHTEIVRFLVQQCAQINSCRTVTGENAIHVTAATNNVEVMNILLDNGGDVNGASKHSKGGQTALHKAVMANMPDMVGYLCQRGANPNVSDAFWKYPIHIASEKGFKRCISILILFGASLDVVDSHKQTPLIAAIVENQTEAAKLLVNEGASVHTPDKIGYTPLHTASMRGNVELIDFFVSVGADINARMQTSLQTPLMSAVNLGKLEAVHTLISLGADVTLPNDKGQTPLHYVHMKLAGAPVDAIVKALLEGGGCLDSRDTGNLTPIQRGIVISVIRKAKIIPWLQLMCQAGSFLGPDEFTYGKHSPLFWLAYSGLLKEALYLVRAGWYLGEETWIVLPGKNDQQNILHKYMIARYQTVPSLLSCCRNVIRSHILEIREHREILSSVDKLPIPDTVKSFLKLYDIDPEDDSILDPDDAPDLQPEI